MRCNKLYWELTEKTPFWNLYLITQIQLLLITFHGFSQESYDKIIPPSFIDLGYHNLVVIYSDLSGHGNTPHVIDTESLHEDPEVHVYLYIYNIDTEVFLGYICSILRRNHLLDSDCLFMHRWTVYGGIYYRCASKLNIKSFEAVFFLFPIWSQHPLIMNA